MLDVEVRYEQKDATIRFLPSKVKLDQILMRYDDTPFDAALEGPIISIARSARVTLRGWTLWPALSETSETADDHEDAEGEADVIQAIVEMSPAKSIRIAQQPQLSFTDAALTRLDVVDEFGAVASPVGADDAEAPSLPSALRFTARLTETISLEPGEMTVPVRYSITTRDADQRSQTWDETFGLVLHTPQRSAKSSSESATDVALVGGELELRVGHLCDQTGCIEHFHKALQSISGLAGVRPRASLENPRADLYLRTGLPIDVWNLCNGLRDEGIEVAGLVTKGLSACRLRVELPSWQIEGESQETQQCLACRDRVASLVGQLQWAGQPEVAGGGVHCQLVQPQVDLIELCHTLAAHEIAPTAIWLVPADAPMPKAAPPQRIDQEAAQKLGGSNVHPVVEFHFGHTCDVSAHPLAVLGKRPWPSRTHAEPTRETTILRAAIGDRKFANLTPILREFRSMGHTPRSVRLTQFGDLRIQLEFAHICGDVEYSKPPKKKEQPAEDEPQADDSAASESDDADRPEDASDDASSDPNGPSQEQRSASSEAVKSTSSAADGSQEQTECCPASKPKKPFVPKPIRPAESSNGRRAIEAALAEVGWIQRATFEDYHTRPEFTGPRKLMLSGQVSGEDVAPLDELLTALSDVGFPPTSVIVSRRFPGIPFGQRLPADLLVTDHQGRRISLASRRTGDQPLAVAFVSLKCARYEEYQPDPKLYQHMAQTIEAYSDRVKFVAVAANPNDRFSDVAAFWEQTGIPIPLLHDADGQVQSVFNSQATPPPHMFVFDAEERLRYAGEPHDKWEATDGDVDDFLARALERVLDGSYEANGAVFFNKSVCNCSDPNCKCPKCGCGSTCRCTIKH